MSIVTTRLATPADAHEATVVLRASITELCALDHQHDAPTLERWLRNKTPEIFRGWCADSESRMVVAERGGAIAGVATLHRSGEILLCYVGPVFVRTGVGHALLLALEDHARDWGITTLRLRSSQTARQFYEHHGFESAGDPTSSFGVLLGYPYTKVLK